MFRDVLAQDPSCAIATWGIASLLMSNPLAGAGSSPKGAAQARAAIEQGRKIGAKTQRERDYIEAVAAYYEDWTNRFEPDRQRSRAKAYEALAARYPDDDEAQIFYALYLAGTQSQAEQTFATYLKSASILEKQFTKYPDHPGVAHYLIHSYDAPPIAQKGLPAARRYASIAPAAPHALHMPSHIFTRVGAWADSAATNRRSADTAKKGNDKDEQMHALDYMVYASVRRLLFAAGVCVAALAISYAMTWACYGFRYGAAGDASTRLNVRPVVDATPGLASTLLMKLGDAHLLPEAWVSGLLYAHQSTRQRNAFLLDRVAPMGWWYYFSLAMAVKSPLTLLAAGILALVFTLTRRRLTSERTGAWTLLCLAVSAASISRGRNVVATQPRPAARLSGLPVRLHRDRHRRGDWQQRLALDPADNCPHHASTGRRVSLGLPRLSRVLQPRRPGTGSIHLLGDSNLVGTPPHAAFPLAAATPGRAGFTSLTWVTPIPRFTASATSTSPAATASVRPTSFAASRACWRSAPRSSKASTPATPPMHSTRRCTTRSQSKCSADRSISLPGHRPSSNVTHGSHARHNVAHSHRRRCS